MSITASVIVGVVAIAVYALLAHAAANGSDTAHRVTFAVCIFGIVIGPVVLLYSLVGAGIQCDETCDPSTGHWYDTAGAWQWYLQPALAAIATATVAVAGKALLRHRYGRSLAWMAAAAGASAVWVALVGPL